MALTGTYIFKGVSLPGAQVRVNTLEGGEQGWRVVAAVYADAAQVEPLERLEFQMDYASGFDPVAMAEDSLLNKPAFTGFVLVSPRRYTRKDFLKRFTLTERVNIRAASKVDGTLEDYLELLHQSQFIDLTDPDTVSGVNTLESAGLIAVGRATEILTP